MDCEPQPFAGTNEVPKCPIVERSRLGRAVSLVLVTLLPEPHDGSMVLSERRRLEKPCKQVVF